MSLLCCGGQNNKKKKHKYPKPQFSVQTHSNKPPVIPNVYKRGPDSTFTVKEDRLIRKENTTREIQENVTKVKPLKVQRHLSSSKETTLHSSSVNQQNSNDNVGLPTTKTDKQAENFTKAKGDLVNTLRIDKESNKDETLKHETEAHSESTKAASIQEPVKNKELENIVTLKQSNSSPQIVLKSETNVRQTITESAKFNKYPSLDNVQLKARNDEFTREDLIHEEKKNQEETGVNKDEAKVILTEMKEGTPQVEDKSENTHLSGSLKSEYVNRMSADRLKINPLSVSQNNDNGRSVTKSSVEDVQNAFEVVDIYTTEHQETKPITFKRSASTGSLRSTKDAGWGLFGDWGFITYLTAAASDQSLQSWRTVSRSSLTGSLGRVQPSTQYDQTYSWQNYNVDLTGLL